MRVVAGLSEKMNQPATTWGMNSHFRAHTTGQCPMFNVKLKPKQSADQMGPDALKERGYGRLELYPSPGVRRSASQLQRPKFEPANTLDRPQQPAASGDSPSTTKRSMALEIERFDE